MVSEHDFILNKELNENEFKEGKVILQSKPRSLRVILTNLCNINCIMCGSSFAENKFVLPYEALKEVTNLFRYLEFINWQGGEVFLIDYFKDIFKKTCSFRNIQQEIQTNGLLLDEEWVELLVKQNVNLSFSIDGATKETYEYIRRRGSFEKLSENLSLLNRLRQKYNSHSYMTLCACIMKSNYKEVGEFVEFAKRYDFQRIVFGFIKGNFALQENIFYPSDEEATEYLRKTMPVIEDRCYANGIQMHYYFKPVLWDRCNNYPTEQIRQEDIMQPLRCKHPWRQLLIDGIRGGGNVYPDCMCQNSIGNILEESILDIWNGVRMQHYRRDILNGDFHSTCSEVCNKGLIPEDYFV